MRVFDDRWRGAHGIGRFATELYGRLPGFVPIKLAGSPARALDPFVLERYLRDKGASFFFSPGYNVPLTRKIAFAFCLHDLNHLADDEPRGTLKKKYYEWIVRPAVSKAMVVFTVSEFSRTQICEWANVEYERVINVGNGVSSVFRHDGAAYSAAEYFLHVGGARPHKNLLRVMRALANSTALRDINLVCVGGGVNEVMALAESCGLRTRTIAFQGLSDERLAEVYRGAIGLVFASLREGFGLPIIEAMACGCPVITSRISSMPEVSGGAALLVDPNDVDDISDKMERVAFSSLLRSELVAAGKVRSSSFSWELTASGIAAALKKCNL